MKARIDMVELSRSLKKATKSVGATNKNATTRWAVATARELAIQTQPHGKAGTKKIMSNSVRVGINSCVLIGHPNRIKRGGPRIATSLDQLNSFVESNRDNKGRARWLHRDRRMICSRQMYNQLVKSRLTKIGKAKGGWVGAGREIAKRQRGRNREIIGKSFLKWTERHQDKGSGKLRKSLFNPLVFLSHRSRHVKNSMILKRSDANRSVYWALKKTIKRYEIEARKALSKR